MNSKIVLVVLDGLGDRPIVALNGLTPLESARTPHLSLLAEKAECGLLDAIGVGVRPTSDVAILNMLGYLPEKYYSGRGPLEALGTGLSLKEGDVCFRVNFATVDSQLKVVDRRAGRISDCSVFEKELNGIEVEGVKFVLKAGLGHRAALVMRGIELSPSVSEIDSHAAGKKVPEAKPLSQEPAAKRAASFLNEYLKKARVVLKKHKHNKERQKQKLPPANYLLVRGAGTPPKLPSFEEKYGLKSACVAAEGLYKGVARAAGMHVIPLNGATGKSDSDLLAKVVAVKKNIPNYDFLLLHVKATDNFGHDGDFVGKRNFIERVDGALKELVGLHHAVVVVTGDHSTPCEMRDHSGDPVPIMFSGDGLRKDNVKKFGERECAKGIVGRISGKDVMPEALNLAGRAPLFGS